MNTLYNQTKNKKRKATNIIYYIEQPISYSFKFFMFNCTIIDFHDIKNNYNNSTNYLKQQNNTKQD